MSFNDVEKILGLIYGTHLKIPFAVHFPIWNTQLEARSIAAHSMTDY